MRQAARVDANQAEIVKALRGVGAKVCCTHQLGQGFPDLLVGWRGDLMLIEIKDGDKIPSKRKLTPDEKAFHDEWQDYRVYVVESPLQALVMLGFDKPREARGWRIYQRMGYGTMTNYAVLYAEPGAGITKGTPVAVSDKGRAIPTIEVDPKKIGYATGPPAPDSAVKVLLCGVMPC